MNLNIELDQQLSAKFKLCKLVETIPHFNMLMFDIGLLEIEKIKCSNGIKSLTKN